MDARTGKQNRHKRACYPTVLAVPFDQASVRLWFQVDVYGILAKAPPAETRNGPREAEVAGNPKIPTRGKNKRPWGPINRVQNARSCGKYLIQADPTPEVAYVARDPLGDEVAELDAKIRENARR